MRKQVPRCSAHFCGHATETLRSIQGAHRGPPSTRLSCLQRPGRANGLLPLLGLSGPKAAPCAAELQTHLQEFTGGPLSVLLLPPDRGTVQKRQH